MDCFNGSSGGRTVKLFCECAACMKFQFYCATVPMGLHRSRNLLVGLSRGVRKGGTSAIKHTHVMLFRRDYPALTTLRGIQPTTVSGLHK